MQYVMHCVRKDTRNGTVLIFVKTIWDIFRAEVGFDPWTTWVSVQHLASRPSRLT